MHRRRVGAWQLRGNPWSGRAKPSDGLCTGGTRKRSTRPRQSGHAPGGTALITPHLGTGGCPKGPGRKISHHPGHPRKGQRPSIHQIFSQQLPGSWGGGAGRGLRHGPRDAPVYRQGSQYRSRGRNAAVTRATMTGTSLRAWPASQTSPHCPLGTKSCTGRRDTRTFKFSQEDGGLAEGAGLQSMNAGPRWAG